ncbi:MAG: pentapeptide repeat-containing protein [Cyanobacteria bacterium P01_D01_bin.116]
MISEQHLNILRQGFKVWNLWRRRNPRTIPKLKGADLKELNLCKVNLSGMDLSEVDLSGTSLFQANLSGANLYRANLSNAILQETDLSDASLIKANLKNKKFPQTNLSGANLTKANLSGAKFYTHTSLSKTNFSFSNLSGADLSELNLRGNNFSGANLCKANLNITNLSGANLNGANLSEANLEYANLRKTQIQEATIDEKWYLVWEIVNNGVQGRELQGVDLSMADLEEANLNQANLSSVNFTRTKLRNTNLRETNLSGANFKYVNLRTTQIQGAIIDEKWYLVWDIVNNGAEERDLNEADISEADLSKANFKNGNLSRVNFSSSILCRADFSWTDLTKANFSKANLAEVNFSWADLSEANLSEVEGFNSIICSGANFSHANFCEISISSSLLNEFREQGANFDEHLSGANIWASMGGSFSVRNKKEFFENLLSWKNKETFTKSIKESLSLSEKSFIPGILLYTDEDEQLSLYIRKNFDAFDKLTGDWCTIYLLENPSPQWRKANQNWKRIIKSGLDLSWFRSKPYDKSEVYDIARELNINLSNIPCLVLISPENLSEKLVFEIKEVSPKYFRNLFSSLEKLITTSKSKIGSQVFKNIKINFYKIVVFLDKNAKKSEEQTGNKYVFNSDNISISVEPVNITNNSRTFTIGDVGGDFKPVGSSLMADDFTASGTIAESINSELSIIEKQEPQNLKDDKSISEISVGKIVVATIVIVAFLGGLAAYIFFQISLSKNTVPTPSQEQRIKD